MVRGAEIFLGVFAAAACVSEPTVFDLSGHAVDPFTIDQPVVLVFTRSDCPIANRYAPELSRLHAAYSDRAAFWLVFADERENEDSVRAYLAELDISMPALLDPSGTLVARAKASISPEAAVFVSGGRLVYRGRIDDRFPKLGVSRPPVERDLKDAIERALDGSASALVTRSAVGCYLSDLH